jgi:hypothetical protein
MSFSTILFTDKGRALQSKALAGANLNFTKIVMGSGNLGGQSQITLSAVIEPKVNLSIASLQHKSNYATVKGVFSNADISEGFYWKELGIYAQDPDLGEILYCYGNAGALAEYIPIQSSEIIEKVVSVSLIVGNVSSVSATIDESLVYASKEDLVAVEADLRAKAAGGTGTAISVNMDSATAYMPGMVVRIIATADNNSEATTLKINDLLAKPVYKVNTQAAPKIVTGKPYTFILSADLSHFFLEASAEGDAIAANVLAGKTFSNGDDTSIIGSMPNNGSIGVQNLTTDGAEYTIPAGYHNGLGKVKAAITGLIASVIKAGVTVGGILGTFTSDATAADSDVLSGKSYYRNGLKGIGNLVKRTGAIYQGYEAAIARVAANGRLHFFIPKGAYIDSRVDGAGGVSNEYPGVYFDDANFLPSNIKKDVPMFGMIGTLPAGLQGASGTVWSTANGTQLPFYNRGANATQMYPYFTVSGLNFKPKMIVARKVADYNSFYHNVYYNVNTAIPGQGTISSNGSTWSDKDSGEGASWGAYVTATGFQLPVQMHSSEYQWWAFTW